MPDRTARLPSRVRCAALFAALLLPTAASGQSLLERTPNLSGGWVGQGGTAEFHLLHRFSTQPNPRPEGQTRLVGSPTILVGYPLANLLLLGARYSSASQTVSDGLKPNEWEIFARFAPLQPGIGLPFHLAFTGAYNGAAGSIDGEVALGVPVGPVTFLGVLRTFSNGFASDTSRLALGGGMIWRPRPNFALVGDVVSPTGRRAGEVLAWGGGIQMGLPSTPHTISLHAANTATGTLQGASRGTTQASGGGTRWGFEITVPVSLPRLLGGGAGRRDVTLTADTVRVAILDSGFSPERIQVRAGTTVLWIGEGDLPHSTVSNSELWESPLLTAGESYQRIFREAGEYPYHCALHPTMAGVIVVQGG